VPDVRIKAMHGVPKNLDKAMWDFLNTLRYNIEVLAGMKGSASNRYVTLAELLALSGTAQYVEVADIDDPSPELSSRTSTEAGPLLIAYQPSAGADDAYTIYAWDASGGASDSPYVVAGDGGNWTAVGGTYSDQDLHLDPLTASFLVATDAAKKLVSTNLADWITAVANETTVADDGAGGAIIGIVNPLIVAKGGTGAETLTDHGLLVGSGTGAITALAAAANGQIPIGSTGADPVLSTLTGVANEIDITVGAGSITIGIVDPLIVGKGGSGGTTFTDGGVLLGSGANPFTATARLDTDQLLAGQAAGDPQPMSIVCNNDAVVCHNDEVVML